MNQTIEIPSLQNISFYALIQRIGTHTNEIIIGKKYMMLEKNGVDFIPLGKCVKNEYSPGYYQNDFTPSRELSFELNNNHPLLKKKFYGNYEINSIINVLEDNQNEKSVSN